MAKKAEQQTSDVTTELVDINADLAADYEPAPVDLVVEYWSPAAVGESKLVRFEGIRTQRCPDYNDPEKEVDLTCCVFYEPQTGRFIKNGSARLVAVFEDNEIREGAAFLIQYEGRQKNARNTNESDRWSVRPLVKKANA